MLVGVVLLLLGFILSPCVVCVGSLCCVGIVLSSSEMDADDGRDDANDGNDDVDETGRSLAATI